MLFIVFIYICGYRCKTAPLLNAVVVETARGLPRNDKARQGDSLRIKTNKDIYREGYQGLLGEGGGYRNRGGRKRLRIGLVIWKDKKIGHWCLNIWNILWRGIGIRRRSNIRSRIRRIQKHWGCITGMGGVTDTNTFCICHICCHHCTPPPYIDGILLSVCVCVCVSV